MLIESFDIPSKAEVDPPLPGQLHLARVPDRPLLHICYAPSDHEWVHSRKVRELDLIAGQYRTRADDGLSEVQLEAFAHAVDERRFTVLIASNAARWDKVAQFATALAQHAGLEDGTQRLRRCTPKASCKR
jgi:hypothetical protein